MATLEIFKSILGHAHGLRPLVDGIRILLDDCFLNGEELTQDVFARCVVVERRRRRLVTLNNGAMLSHHTTQQIKHRGTTLETTHNPRFGLISLGANNIEIKYGPRPVGLRCGEMPKHNPGDTTKQKHTTTLAYK